MLQIAVDKCKTDINGIVLKTCETLMWKCQKLFETWTYLLVLLLLYNQKCLKKA